MRRRLDLKGERSTASSSSRGSFPRRLGHGSDMAYAGDGPLHDVDSGDQRVAGGSSSSAVDSCRYSGIALAILVEGSMGLRI